MPDGTHAWKIIKIGVENGRRIAQACDRCRSKKIKCDGLEPCTHCKNVGFECRTSDRLSRKAYPRGYTETLEERVRKLELENRELRAELDDALAVGKETRCRPLKEEPPPSPSDSAVESLDVSEQDNQPKISFTATDQGLVSTTRFISRFERDFNSKSGSAIRLDEFQKLLGRDRCGEVVADTYDSQLQLSHIDLRSLLPGPSEVEEAFATYYNTWHCILPLLHWPTFVASYRRAVVESDEAITLENNPFATCLVLVLAISYQTGRFPEKLWRIAKHMIASIEGGCSLETTQVNLLAQVYHLSSQQPDTSLKYSLATLGQVMRLGIYRTTKDYALGKRQSVIELETRRRVLWCAYTLDAISSLSTCSTMLIRDDLFETEFPTNM